MRILASGGEVGSGVVGSGVVGSGVVGSGVVGSGVVGSGVVGSVLAETFMVTLSFATSPSPFLADTTTTYVPALANVYGT